MRRKYLGGLGAATLLLAAVGAQPVGAAPEGLPRTGFERSGGSSWTTWPEERNFLRTINRQSKRVKISNVGRSSSGRAIRLVKIGHPRPHKPSEAQGQPTVLFVCSQHGDEPAAREACLSLIRDLAYTFGQMYVKQLRDTTVLVMPTVNPDGVVAEARGNPEDDVNRDHLNLRTRETRAVARVALDWRPDVVIDLHDVDAPGDEEVLYMWPRDLNVDEEIHDLAMRIGTNAVESQARANGFSSGPLATSRLDESDPHRATDRDEGALVNALGLRHAASLFVGSTVAVDEEGEDSDEAAINRRRVESHFVSTLAVLQFLRSEGDQVVRITAGAARRKTEEGSERSAPVYLDGADNEDPTEVLDPPPCGYVLNDRQFRKVSRTMALLDIAALGSTEGIFVPMGQPAEPLIPLVLDARAWRHEVAAEPEMSC